MADERPHFDTMDTLNIVKCNLDPLLCPARHVSKPLTPNKSETYFCWHEESPEPDQSVFPSWQYRRCATKPKDTDSAISE